MQANDDISGSAASIFTLSLAKLSIVSPTM